MNQSSKIEPVNRKSIEDKHLLQFRNITAIFFFTLLIFSSVYAQNTNKILVINAYHRGYHWSDGLMDGIQSEFKKVGSDTQVYFESDAKLCFEYLDTMRCDPNTVFPAYERLMQSKYKNVKFDVIISCSNNSLAFLRACRNELFPNVPIVFVGVNLFEDWMIKGLEPVTGIGAAYDKEATIDAALKLHPSATQVVLVRNIARDYPINLEGIMKRFEGRTKFVVLDISAMSYEQFVKKVSEYGSESILMFPNFLSDSTDKFYNDKMISELFRRCTAPVYINAFALIGRSPVGGSVNYGVHHGKLAADMAIRILNGENAQNIQIIRKGPTDFMFDYNQLKRFGISLSQLPAESTIINKPKSLYRDYKKQILIITTAFAILSTIILLLSVNIIRRRRVEKKLLQYQAQLKSLASELSLTEERERRRIATELHDRISQALVISKMMLEQLRSSEKSPPTVEVLDSVCKMLSETIQSSRLLTFDLSSPILYELGFETAVADWLTEEIERKYKIESEFEDDGQLKPMEDDIRAMLFRTVRELLINVVKHAHAGKVKVSVQRVDSQISVCVEDDGAGFDSGKAFSAGPRAGGFGLFSIRERLEQLGGRFEIKSSIGKGCRVTISVPLKLQNAAE